MIRFLPLGGANEIGANCYYINISGTGILLDCGIHPRKIGTDSLPRFDLLEELPLDFVVISHAHQDHIGSLPYLVQKFPHVVIYTTTQTKEIAEITLHNAANILKERLTGTDVIKPYSHEEIDLLVRSIRSFDYNEKFSFRGLRHETSDDIEVSLFDAGHILGSASILLEHKGFTIFYTGDINLSSQEILAGAELPLKNINLLITETTYAGTDSTEIGLWKEEKIKFTRSANKIIEQGGSILIPVFALGKTQEVLFVIHNLMQRGVLTDIPIFTGGIGRQISYRYDLNRYKVKRNYVELEFKEIPQEDLYETNIFNSLRKTPSIVLASSGMMIEKTMSYNLACEWLKQKLNSIFIVGYMDSETPGYRVANSKRGDEIVFSESSKPVNVKCSIERFYFPSHSKREELLRIVELLKPEQVILVHGDNNAVGWLGMKILQTYPGIKVHAAEIENFISF
ncbi:MAG: exonuclease [Ignavibacteria bacterium RBG_13_36_8]|nr:MAG: exonuclease [Ignavibacteria bacterium RBG_13_36_8]